MCVDRPGLMNRPEEAWRWVQEGLWGSLVGGGQVLSRLKMPLRASVGSSCIPWARGCGVSDGGTQPTLEQSGEEGCTSGTRLRRWHTPSFNRDARRT